MNYNEMSNEELITEHANLKDKKCHIEKDIKDDEEAIEEATDYMTRIEWQQDLRDDKRALFMVEEQINLIEPVMEQRNIIEGKVLTKKIN